MTDVTENICEPLLKDSSDEEELFDWEEDEVYKVHESDHNPETEKSDSETEADCIMWEWRRDDSRIHNHSICMEKIMKQSGKKMRPLIMFALEL
jgi:hypothetical protein